MVFFFLPAHFHHIIEQLRFRQSSVGSIFLSAGEPGELARDSLGLGCDIPDSHSTERAGNTGLHGLDGDH